MKKDLETSTLNFGMACMEEMHCLTQRGQWEISKNGLSKK